MSAGNARLFIAADVPDAVRHAYAAAREDLVRRAPSARWVKAEGLHLTFKFLGPVPRVRIESLGSALSGAVAGAAPFHLTTGETGFFGSPRRPRVLWLALEGEIEAACLLAQSIATALAPLGFPPEDRPFRPHMTLARFAQEKTEVALDVLLQSAASALRGRPMPVDTVVLFESHLGRGGSRYDALRTVPLGSGPS